MECVADKLLNDHQLLVDDYSRYTQFKREQVKLKWKNENKYGKNSKRRVDITEEDMAINKFPNSKLAKILLLNLKTRRSYKIIWKH